MHALTIGATGATGADLLEILLKDDSFKRVDIFVRRAPDLRHEKLNVHVIDFDAPERWRHLVKGDVLFSCLGTTIKAAGSQEAQWKIDYDYQYRFARIARDNGVNNYILVSAGFASPHARFFYSRMKGQLEEAVKALAFEKLTIFNPPILIRKNSDRAMEAVGTQAIRYLNKLGMLRSQKPLPTEVLARAMANSAKRNENGMVALEDQAIWDAAQDEAEKWHHER
ncbi:NAD(P)H-binding protein [Cohnella ginsengisoli]|uniref:NAD(P)H-binding protein n=1 Tax=Cohnella ginsengisoli TaxID=425004 RepID=A0A9X4QMC9_9BACL|nr:NAD(P)H-binding protein [Cohnella ginsengisoli]MDG0791077.1 NAD(P)H-binding protein [Cohnella ginsengisoli]